MPTTDLWIKNEKAECEGKIARGTSRRKNRRLRRVAGRRRIFSLLFY